MNLDEIYQRFADCKSWEERYRLLIQFSRQLPKLSEEELVQLPEIHSCESRLWFDFQLEPRNVRAYSDARLMQGLLMIATVALKEKSAAELVQFSLADLFEQLKIAQNLTSTRLNGVAQLDRIVAEKLAC